VRSASKESVGASFAVSDRARSLLLFAFAVLPSLACGPRPIAAPLRPSTGKATTESTERVAPETSAGDVPKKQPATEPVIEVIGEEPPSAPTPPLRPQIHFNEHYPDAEQVGLLDWKKAHHATGPTFEQGCWELASGVGVPAVPGLLCLAMSENPPFTLARVYRLEGARLREVWSATIRTWTNWLELTPLLSPNGERLFLRDRFSGACEGAMDEAHAKAQSNKAPPSAELLTPACAALGEYAYERGKYRRTLTR